MHNRLPPTSPPPPPHICGFSDAQSGRTDGRCHSGLRRKKNVGGQGHDIISYKLSRWTKALGLHVPESHLIPIHVFSFFFLKNLCALKLCRTFSDVLRESQRECTTHYTHTLAFLASGMARADGTWAGWSEVDPTLHCASTCASTAQFPTQQKKLEEKKKKRT